MRYFLYALFLLATNANAAEVVVTGFGKTVEEALQNAKVAAVEQVADPATPVNGPFSADFKWATLPEGDGTPIRFTDGQAKVFGALWSFKGQATTADRIMQRAGLDSAKPSDLLKVKAKDKGKPGPAAQHAAYGALVVTQQRAGLYAMPCAAAGKEIAMT